MRALITQMLQCRELTDKVLLIPNAPMPAHVVNSPQPKAVSRAPMHPCFKAIVTTHPEMQNRCIQRRDTGRSRRNLACFSAGLAKHIAYLHNLACSDGHVLGQISRPPRTTFLHECRHAAGMMQSYSHEDSAES